MVGLSPPNQCNLAAVPEQVAVVAAVNLVQFQHHHPYRRQPYNPSVSGRRSGAADFCVMPPRLIHHHRAGQCPSRRAGIKRRLWRWRCLFHRQVDALQQVGGKNKVAFRFAHHVMGGADHFSLVTVAVLPAPTS